MCKESEEIMNRIYGEVWTRDQLFARIHATAKEYTVDCGVFVCIVSAAIAVQAAH